MTIRDLRTAIANSVEPNHKLSLTEWLNRAARIHPDIDELLDSMPDVFFAKESGSYQTGQLPSFAHTAAGRPTYHALVFGWCYGAIEYAYLSQVRATGQPVVNHAPESQRPAILTWL